MIAALPPVLLPNSRVMIRFYLKLTEWSCWGSYSYSGDRIRLLLVLKYHTSSQLQSCMDFSDLLPILLVYVQLAPNGTFLGQLSYHEQLWAWHCTSENWICVFSTIVHHHPLQDCISLLIFFFCIFHSLLGIWHELSALSLKKNPPQSDVSTS